jgi:hypothetical protein
VQVNARCANDFAVGHDVKRCYVVSCAPVLHMMHAVMASQFFLCRLCVVCNLSSRVSQMKNFIFGGSRRRLMLLRIGFGIPGLLRKL